MNRLRIVALVCVLTAFPAARAGVRWFDGDFEAARAEARASNRLVLVDCWATWCKFCYEMDDNVWSRDDVARVVAHETVPLRLEVDERKGAGVAFARTYDVEGLPHILVIEPEHGRVLQRLEGYQSAEQIIAAIDAASEEWRSARAAARSDDPAELVREGSRLLRAGDAATSESLLRRALVVDADCAAREADDAALLLAGIVAGRDGPEAADRLLAATLEHCREPGEAAPLWSRRLELARERGGEVVREITLARHRALPDDTDAALDAAALLVEQRRGDDLDEARRICEALVARVEDDPRPLGLLARIEFVSGRLDRAADAIDRAIAIDPHDLDLRQLRFEIELARRTRREPQ